MKLLLTKIMLVAIMGLSELGYCQPQISHLPSNEVAMEQQVQIAEKLKQALIDGNYHHITPYIHPIKGVGFSMYYDDVNLDTNQVLSPQTFEKQILLPELLVWGEEKISADNTTRTFIASLPNYLSRWVLQKDNPNSYPLNEWTQDMSISPFAPFENTNNLKQLPTHRAYQGLTWVGYAHDGTDELEWADWQRLYFVFETYQNAPYLVAIITDRSPFLIDYREYYDNFTHPIRP